MSITNEYLGFLSSNSLWLDKKFLSLTPFNFADLAKFDSCIDSPIKINIRENEVLGKRIEHFFEYSIINSNRYTIIANNIQVFKDKITIGELDFLVKDLQKNKVIHVELVYKFYLFDPTIDGNLHRWIGPNRKDTLLQKAEKIKEKQLPLLYHKETSGVLKKLQLDSDTIEQQVCYLANLFIPFSLKKTTFPYINNQCIVGYWIPIKAFTLKEYGSYQFYIPQKKDWVIAPKHCNSWFSFKDIIESIEVLLSQKKSPLLWMKSNEDSYLRFFIVWW